MSTNWNSRGIILSIPQCFANQRWQLPWKSHSSDHEFYYAEKLKKSNTKKGIRCLITQIWNFYGYCGHCHSDCCSSSFWRGEKVFVFNIFQRGRGVIFRRFPNWIDFRIYLFLKFCISHCHMINVININLFKTIISRSLVHVLYHHQYM